MIKKMLLTMIASTLSINAFAGLTVCATNYPNKVDVYCNSVKSPAPIPASANSTQCASLAGISDISWFALKIQGLYGKCEFKDNKTNAELGSATLEIAGNNREGKVTSTEYNPNKYQVNISPGTGTYYKEINVNIINLQ